MGIDYLSNVRCSCCSHVSPSPKNPARGRNTDSNISGVEEYLQESTHQPEYYRSASMSHDSLHDTSRSDTNHRFCHPLTMQRTIFCLRSSHFLSSRSFPLELQIMVPHGLRPGPYQCATPLVPRDHREVLTFLASLTIVRLSHAGTFSV